MKAGFLTSNLVERPHLESKEILEDIRGYQILGTETVSIGLISPLLSGKQSTRSLVTLPSHSHTPGSSIIPRHLKAGAERIPIQNEVLVDESL
jgi:hypothetical protein